MPDLCKAGTARAQVFHKLFAKPESPAKITWISSGAGESLIFSSPLLKGLDNVVDTFLQIRPARFQIFVR
jgi:hypothetical protein